MGDFQESNIVPRGRRCQRLCSGSICLLLQTLAASATTNDPKLNHLALDAAIYFAIITIHPDGRMDARKSKFEVIFRGGDRFS